jgi:hypothetical protein
MASISANTKTRQFLVGLETLLYQTLETELGGVQLYEAASRLAVDNDLREEWLHYLAETRRHVELARYLLVTAGLDPDADVPARQPVRMIGEALVQSIRKVADEGHPSATQIAAAEAIVLAETKDHANWELIGMAARSLEGDLADAMRAAYAEVEEQEDRHLYHTAGWARELRIRSLGLPAALPPPEETDDVASAIAAARAKRTRDRHLH